MKRGVCRHCGREARFTAKDLCSRCYCKYGMDYKGCFQQFTDAELYFLRKHYGKNAVQPLPTMLIAARLGRSKQAIKNKAQRLGLPAPPRPRQSSLVQPEEVGMREVFTTGQVARLCRVAPRTVSKWFDAGLLKGYRIPCSKDRRIPRKELIKFLEANGMPLGELAGVQPRVLLIGAAADLVEYVRLELEGDCVVVGVGSLFEAGLLLTKNELAVLVFDLQAGRSDALAAVKALSYPVRERTGLVALACEDEGDMDELNGLFDLVLCRPFHVSLVAKSIRRLSEGR